MKGKWKEKTSPVRLPVGDEAVPRPSVKRHRQKLAREYQLAILSSSYQRTNGKDIAHLPESIHTLLQMAVPSATSVTPSQVVPVTSHSLPM
jgi:hypothetical protein